MACRSWTHSVLSSRKTSSRCCTGREKGAAYIDLENVILHISKQFFFPSKTVWGSPYISVASAEGEELGMSSDSDWHLVVRVVNLRLFVSQQVGGPQCAKDVILNLLPDNQELCPDKLPEGCPFLKMSWTLFHCFIHIHESYLSLLSRITHMKCIHLAKESLHH